MRLLLKPPSFCLPLLVSVQSVLGSSANPNEDVAVSIAPQEHVHAEVSLKFFKGQEFRIPILELISEYGIIPKEELVKENSLLKEATRNGVILKLPVLEKKLKELQHNAGALDSDGLVFHCHYLLKDVLNYDGLSVEEKAPLEDLVELTRRL